MKNVSDCREEGISIDIDPKSHNSGQILKNRNQFVELTLDVHEDSVVVHSVSTALNDDDPESSDMSRPNSSLGPSFRNASAKLKQFSEELKTELRKLSFNSRVLEEQSKVEFDRSKSGAQRALKGLRFVSNATENADEDELWSSVERH